jgi:nucleoside-diphosphate-sugar epimerase
MRALVTGGTGFTGSHLVRRLVRKGHTVVAMDNQKGLFFEELQALGATCELASVTEETRVAELVESSEIVFHLAAAFRQLDVPKKLYWDVNVEGTRNLLEASKQSGVRRFIYCSTQGVHGHIENPPGDEGSPIAPADYYQYTKYEGEKLVAEYVDKGLDALTLRPTAIYGPGDPARFLILFRLAKRGVFYMFGSGRTTYHPVYIENLVDAFELAAEQDGLAGSAYIIGDAHYFGLNELVRHVGQAMGITVRIRHLPFWPLWAAAVACEIACKPLGISPPLFRRRVDWFRQVRAFKIDKAVQELGYKPNVGLKEGLAKTGEWYKANGYL